MWLRDEAGNQPESTAVLKGVKWDDQPPGDAMPDAINGYVSAGEAVEWQPVKSEEIPVSEIAGYAVAFDQDPDGDPDEEITHPGEDNRTTELPGSVSEGESYIHVRAISGAGVPGPVNSELIKVDQTKPTVDVTGHTDSWQKGPVTIGLTASDSYSGVDPQETGSGLMYSVDGGSTQVAQGTTESIDFYRDRYAHVEDIRDRTSQATEVTRQNLSVRVDSKPPTLGFVKAKEPRRPDGGAGKGSR